MLNFMQGKIKHKVNIKYSCYLHYFTQSSCYFSPVYMAVKVSACGISWNQFNNISVNPLSSLP